MGITDKAKHKAEELAGKAKEAVGRSTDDREMEAEGRGEQGKANLKQAGDKAKDAAKDAFGKKD